MITVQRAKRLVKRALLANVATQKKGMSITPLLSGRHGIGKTAILRDIARDLDGTVITIEGGTLKEGEITGLPYQYQAPDGSIAFKFLPYYAVDRIQRQERALFESLHGVGEQDDQLVGFENRYSMNDIDPQQKIDYLLSGAVKPVIVLIDEINRTENTVYRELMNILLTKEVNGYRFPWWVFFVGAMNPSTQNSAYATNEMDPAQLDRFIKLKVGADVNEWLEYGDAEGINSSILSFVRDNPACLVDNLRELEDEERATPSPRGWDMVDTILSSEPMLRPFFCDAENDPAIVREDMKELVSAKLGSTVAAMYFASLVAQERPLNPSEVLGSSLPLEGMDSRVSAMSVAKRVQTCDLLLDYLKDNAGFMRLDANGFDQSKKRLSSFVSALDPSTKLLFAQKVAGATSNEGENLLELFYDVFERDLISALDLSDRTRKAIETE